MKVKTVGVKLSINKLSTSGLAADIEKVVKLRRKEEYIWEPTLSALAINRKKN